MVPTKHRKLKDVEVQILFLINVQIAIHTVDLAPGAINVK